MKNMIKLPALLVGLLLIFAGTTQTAKAQQQDVSLQSFYDELSPYGVWIKDPQYGYVWRPDVDQDEFRPYYTNGRWAMTEYGNTWVSNYDWGWAPFHYGRWIYNRYNNWVWVPDTVWGPAWVTWRSGGGNYGWAPLGPSISIGINFGRGGYRIPDMCWNFVPYNNIYYNNYPRYYSNRNRVYIQNTVIINNTYVNNNRTYYTGPRADEVRRATNQNVTVYNVNRSNRPGASSIDNNNINIYNPRPIRESNNKNAAPRDVVQGSINRGTISGRDNNINNNNRPERGNNSVYQGDRNASNDRGSVNGNMTRPGRAENDGVNKLEQNRDFQNRSGNVTPQRTERGGQPQETQRIERSRETMPQQNVERNRDIPQQQRVERTQPIQQAPQQRMESNQRQEQPQQQRVERSQPVQQAPQQRMERPQNQQQTPQRVERSQSAPQQRSSGNNTESRGGRGESTGRPVRGGN